MWDLPGPGLEPVSLALAGGFLTTVLPGKPNPFIFAVIIVGVQLKSTLLLFVFHLYILFCSVFYFFLSKPSFMLIQYF